MSPSAFVADRDTTAPVLDVRTPREFATGHLEGAVNADVLASRFEDDIDALELPGSGPVYVYCRSGSRSGRAVRILHDMGHTGAVNVGGFRALEAAGADTTR